MAACVRQTGNALVKLFHYIALFVTGATIVWSAVHFYIRMMASGSQGLKIYFCCLSIWNWAP